MNEQTWKRAPDILHKQKTRREAVLLGASGLMGTSGLAALSAVIGWKIPAIPTATAGAEPDPNSERMIANLEPQALSSVNQEIVQSYRDRYAIFGDTSQIDVVLMDDVNKQEIELPRAMLQGALKSIDPFTARGDVIESYGHYKNFVAAYLDEEDAGAVIALDLYNPYNYLSETLYRREREALRDKLHAPEELFLAAFTVWRLFPDAFIERYNGLPMAVTGNDQESVTGDEPLLQASWEKKLAFLAAENTLLFASALVRSHKDEGEGLVNTRLTQVAPRLGIVKYQMDL
jgi:hypothetical protein